MIADNKLIDKLKKKYKGKKFLLSDFDNSIQKELSLTDDDSIFNEKVIDFLELGSYAYFIGEDDKEQWVNFEFEIMSNNKEIRKIIVIITDVEVLPLF
ncbi:MAG: hypothetical protein LBT51_05580 [Fusobacteriaceae bacterium]|jgi:hypothetical protein|nr:hypothetical protein [Fusobacteriaceae bacterium]